jgi:1,5-anhydro-D-fructose reductase (1,5-anhydro-D-mannitol-forming)
MPGSNRTLVAAGSVLRASSAAEGGRRMETEMATGWAVIGTGIFAANRIVPALSRVTGSRLMAVVSRDRARAAAFAEEHGVPRAYDDLEAAVRDPDVGFVWVATPHSLHLEPVLAAARAGKHVLCEKPLATSRADAREMIRACRRAGVQLGTGFQLRHHPLHKEVARLVQTGALGNVLAVEGEWSTRAGPPGTVHIAPWRLDPALAFAGQTTGTGIHVIDLLRFILRSEVVAVSAMLDVTPDPEGPLESRAVVLLRFASGVLATVRCLRRIPWPANNLVVIGDAGRVASIHSVEEAAQGRLEAEGVDPEVIGLPVGTDAYSLQVEAFVRAVQEDHEPSASGEDGLRLVEILDAILESAKTGRTVSLE